MDLSPDLPLILHLKQQLQKLVPAPGDLSFQKPEILLHLDAFVK